MTRFSHRGPDRPDWSRHKAAPLETASERLNAYAERNGSHRSSVATTVTLWRQLSHRLSVLQRDEARRDKAIRMGDHERAAKFNREVERSVAYGQGVIDQLEARGALMVDDPNAAKALANWRAKGVRLHPERKASAVRFVTERED